MTVQRDSTQVNYVYIATMAVAFALGAVISNIRITIGSSPFQKILYVIIMLVLFGLLYLGTKINTEMFKAAIEQREQNIKIVSDKEKGI